MSVLLREPEGPIIVATMNRPERMNAINRELRQALIETWLDFRDDPELRVMILTGAGDRAFSTGADLKEHDERARTGLPLTEPVRGFTDYDFMANNITLWKPVIAAINGWCLAAGCENAMACDIRIIEEHAQIGLPEVKRGMGAKATSTKLQYLARLGISLEILWTGDPIPANQAHQLGLVDQVVPKGQSVARAKEIARRICRWPQSYLRYHKERVYQSIGLPLDYALAMEQRTILEETEDYREGLNAISEKRPPAWLES